MRKVKEIPPPEYDRLRDPWLDDLLNGDLYQLDTADWSKRYKTSRSAASAIHAAAVKRGLAATIAVRGETLYVQATGNRENGKAPAKAATKRTPAKKAAARKAPARKAAATA